MSQKSNDARIITWSDPEQAVVWFGVWPLFGPTPPPGPGKGSPEMFEEATFAMCLRPEQAYSVAKKIIEAALLASHYLGHHCERGHYGATCGLPDIPPEEQQSSGKAMTSEELRKLWEGPRVDGHEQRGQEENSPSQDGD